MEGLLKVKVLFFALYRERAGRDELVLELPEGASVGTALERVKGIFPALGPSSGSLVTAINAEYTGPEGVLAEGDELALIPPVSGGNR